MFACIVSNMTFVIIVLLFQISMNVQLVTCVTSYVITLKEVISVAAELDGCWMAPDAEVCTPTANILL